MTPPLSVVIRGSDETLASATDKGRALRRKSPRWHPKFLFHCVIGMRTSKTIDGEL
jgi:hypothetical protein